MENTRSDRAHRYLNGDLSRSALTPQEIRELQMHEAIADELQALDRSMKSPDLSRRVMSRVGDRPPSISTTPRISRVWDWVWSPRTVRLRPVYGIAAALALVLAISMGRDDPAPAAGNGQSGTILVQFRIDVPAASSVRLAGSFTDWQPAYALHRTPAGVWSIMVPLDPGVHDYAFLVDGDWTHDPVAPAVADGFGGVNSRLLVLSDEASQL